MCRHCPVFEFNVCCPLFQFNVFARDTGVPSQTSASPAAVTVNVVRNLNAPLYTQSSYAVFINNSLSVGTEVIDLAALDADTQVNTGSTRAGKVINHRPSCLSPPPPPPLFFWFLVRA